MNSFKIHREVSSTRFSRTNSCGIYWFPRAWKSQVWWWGWVAKFSKDLTYIYICRFLKSLWANEPVFEAKPRDKEETFLQKRLEWKWRVFFVLALRVGRSQLNPRVGPCLKHENGGFHRFTFEFGLSCSTWTDERSSLSFWWTVMGVRTRVPWSQRGLHQNVKQTLTWGPHEKEVSGCICDHEFRWTKVISNSWPRLIP